tara:strand:+ start:900 stop:1343 length:444 start_codon:yes stop_codon:yes gene_type:complete
MEDRECFVCLSPKGHLLTDICLCRTLAIHKECQQKLVRSKASTLCGVCKAPYRNVTVTSRQHLRPRIASMMCLCWSNTCMCLSAGIYLSKSIGDPAWMPILVAVLYAGAVGFGMATFYLIVSRELCKPRVQITVHSRAQSVPDADQV